MASAKNGVNRLFIPLKSEVNILVTFVYIQLTFEVSDFPPDGIKGIGQGKARPEAGVSHYVTDDFRRKKWK